MGNILEMRDYNPPVRTRAHVVQEGQALLPFKSLCPHCKKVFVADRVCTAFMDRPCEPPKTQR